MKTYIMDFDEITKDDIDIAGGKGANLGELSSLNLNVPKGAVVTTRGYDLFIKKNKIDSYSIIEDSQDIESALVDIRKKILNSDFPYELEKEILDFYKSLGGGASVAVRSSATLEDLADSSFAGQQDTYLNVVGEESLLKKIRECYASLWSGRAYIYREKCGYDKKNLSIAVVIQQMVESESSGVIFTKNPTTDSDDLLINASYGLGEAVVSGLVSSDEYVFSRDRKLKKVFIGSKGVEIIYIQEGVKKVPVDKARSLAKVLDESQLNRLVDDALKIEAHYGHPMDIEWATLGNRIYILQARRITSGQKEGIKTFSKEDFKDLPKVKRVNSATRESVLFNLEKTPRPYLPLDYDFSNIIGEQKNRLFSEMGLKIRDMNPIDRNGISTFVLSGPMPNFKILMLPNTLRKAKNEKNNTELSTKYFEDCRRRLKCEQCCENENLKELSISLSRMADLIKDTAYSRFKYAVFPQVIENRSLDKVIKKADDNYTAFDLMDGLSYVTTDINREMQGLSYKISKNPELREAVMKLPYSKLVSEFPSLNHVFEDFMKKYGNRSDFNCYCFTAKSWIEDPSRFLGSLRIMIESVGSKTLKTLKTETKFDVIMKTLRSKLDEKTFLKFEKKVKAVRHYHYIREATQYLWESEFAHCRTLLRKASSMLEVDYDDLLFLFADELFDVLKHGKISKDYLDLIEIRKQKRPLAEAYWDSLIEDILSNENDDIIGISGSSGIVTANVCIIESPKEFYKLKIGEVLVCPYTDPEWTVLFNLASAVVVDTGSVLSHAAIVAREYGIPAVLATGDATKRLKDGDLVVVDGAQGRVMFVK